MLPTYSLEYKTRCWLLYSRSLAIVNGKVEEAPVDDTGLRT